MQSAASTWRSTVHCASLRAFVFALVLALAFVAGCSLDDRSVAENEADVSKTDASDDDSAMQGDGASDGGMLVDMRPPRDVPRTAGAGGGGSGGSGGSGGAVQMPQGGTAGESGEVDDDAGPGPDAEPDSGAACTAGNALVPDNGWVDGSTNCVGIQGNVRVDWLDESYILVTVDTGSICAEGFSNEAVPGPFDTAFHLNLNEDLRNGGTAFDYNAEAHGVVGFEFVAEPPAPQPYFGVISDNVLYCARITTRGKYRFALTDLHAECWNGSSGPTPNPTRLRSIGFYSGATTEDPVSFSFCVTDIVALTSLD